MRFPTCRQCDCVKGCQANPVPCPIMLAEVNAAQIKAHRVLDAAIAQPAELKVNVNLCKQCGLVLQNTSTYGHRCDSVYFSAQLGQPTAPVTLTQALNFFSELERMNLWKKFNYSDNTIATITRAVLDKQSIAQPKDKP